MRANAYPAVEINNKKTRTEFWNMIVAVHTPQQIEAALNTLNTDRSRILQLHYLMKYAFKDIAPIMNRSVSYVRQQHNRGILQLQEYFRKQN